MTEQNILKLFKNITEKDIIDAGTDYEGNPVFVLKFKNSISTLIVGNQDIQDYQEFIS